MSCDHYIHNSNSSYDGQYDDLLYYFAYQYEVVRQAMIERDTMAAQKRSASDDSDRQDSDQLQHKSKHPKLD